jgi:hypothetical protein
MAPHSFCGFFLTAEQGEGQLAHYIDIIGLFMMVADFEGLLGRKIGRN